MNQILDVRTRNDAFQKRQIMIVTAILLYLKQWH